MWRSLAVADAGTGRVWNERNRLVADRGFRADNYAACAELYETLIERPLLTACNLAAPGYFMSVQSKYEDSNDTEERSVDLDPQFLEYPSSGTVDCGPITGRCLPVHYLEVDGRPFAPQNLPFVVTNRTIALNVVYAKGPPTNDTSATNWNSEWRSTGELLLRVNYPLRASHSSVIACPTETNPKPNPQTLAISHTNWPVPTRDSDRKTTRIYVKACAATATGGEAETLMELYPRQARYQWRVTNPEYREGGRARHYLNFRTQACGTVEVDYPSTILDEWLGSDCWTTQSRGYYADFYTFSEPSTQTVTIDLGYTGGYVDTYLYLLYGEAIRGTRVIENDDYGGTYNSHIQTNLARGDYTVVATTYSTSKRTGDYKLSILNASCITTPIDESRAYGYWNTSDCKSTRGTGGRYVDYSTFEVEEYTRTVQIDLSSDVDTYLFLISGDDPSGNTYLAYNDDGDGVGLDSRIIRRLAPGAYTIAATTYSQNQTGGYSVEVSGHR